MANTKSAIKRIRTNRRKQVANKTVRTFARTSVKNARAAISSGTDAERAEALRNVYSALDRAAAKGVIHKKNASRRKSRLTKQMAKLTAQK